MPLVNNPEYLPQLYQASKALTIRDYDIYRIMFEGIVLNRPNDRLSVAETMKRGVPKQVIGWWKDDENKVFQLSRKAQFIPPQNKIKELIQAFARPDLPDLVEAQDLLGEIRDRIVDLIFLEKYSMITPELAVLRGVYNHELLNTIYHDQFSFNQKDLNSLDKFIVSNLSA